MQKTLTPAERLIVAADIKPISYEELKFIEPLKIIFSKDCYERPYRGLMREYVRWKVLKLADSLKGTGVYLKVNSALRACGYDLIGEIQSRGLRVFADLKLVDIGKTLSTDGILICEAKPELLTVMCVAGLTAVQALKVKLPDTEVLGVTVLTSLQEADAHAMYGCSIEEAVMRFAEVAAEVGIDGLISSPKQATKLRAKFGNLFTLNTPAIRPYWAIVLDDDQNPDEIMTPAKAIKAGADRIVVGRPIVNAEKPYDAVMRTIDEIASATP